MMSATVQHGRSAALPLVSGGSSVRRWRAAGPCGSVMRRREPARARETKAGMGQDVDRSTFDRHARQRYRANLRRCLDALAVMLAEQPFDTDEPMTGLEVELNLVG